MGISRPCFHIDGQTEYLRFQGHAQNLVGPARRRILDVSNQEIESVELEDGTPLKYEVSDPVPNFGSKLTVKLPYMSAPGNLLKIKVKYSTDPSASALQWLDPNQTSGKGHPYLFSQCQPIHARSILPCQDTPAVKFTYDAQIKAPEEFTVLMSAIRDDNCTLSSESKKTYFNQPVPIPSYLVALAVGVLEYRTLGPRTKVWSEKEEIEQSAWEFAETENYLQAAERLCGPYEWRQYDLLVLPPSFPYGGMENPCLTFVTPTLLAGDRSQADVIVHEIMHSWTGNLITNRNFEHFWLNEGFTVFLERKVAASLIKDQQEAKKSRDFHSLLGLQELSETALAMSVTADGASRKFYELTLVSNSAHLNKPILSGWETNEASQSQRRRRSSLVNHLGPTNPLTQLVLDLQGVHPDDSFSRVPYEKGSLFLRYIEDLVGGPGVHPDDAFSSVPYEKGSLFLRYLEDLVGGPVEFDEFLRSYLHHFKMQSIDTDQFKNYFLDYFGNNSSIEQIDWQSWLYTAGMPPIIPNYDTSMTSACTSLVNHVLTEEQTRFVYTDVSDFMPHQIINFLQQLLERDPLPLGKLRAVGDVYKLKNHKNTEILYRWLRLCARSKDESALRDILSFVNRQGRMKYVRPIYRDLYAWEEVREQAIQNFKDNEQYMMHVTVYTLKKDLHLD
ncbi:Leukotriene A-4 hydrolase [Eumeta japonica]|uniref:Leukotriene A-4 hydrolase n=1 Tax=Eumeta variegata TaxID=151549 RepID=A0A4C1XLT2_EUMVA|nr:Leukotriene A-4 hydrolase [Eumeta japonica]